jgi:hypothetical protein
MANTFRDLPLQIPSAQLSTGSLGMGPVVAVFVFWGTLKTADETPKSREGEYITSSGTIQVLQGSV